MSDVMNNNWEKLRKVFNIDDLRKMFGDEMADRIQYDEGLNRILKAVLAVYEYDWKWFGDKIGRMRTPLANSDDAKNMAELASAFEKIQSVCAYFDKRGAGMQKDASRSHLN